MKRIFTLLLLIGLVSKINSQSIVLYTENNSATVLTGTVVNGAVITKSTSINSEDKARYRLKNISSSTYSYNIVRTIVAQNPLLTVNNASVNPQTFFCFGAACYPNGTNSCPTPFDYTVLGPGEHTDTTAAAIGNAQPFYIYLDEGTSLGFYVVNYKIFNVSNSNDTISFTLKYNDYLTVNEINSTAETMNVFPNPASNSANIHITLKHESPVKVQVYNSLGTLVYNGAEQKLSAGKTKLSIDCSAYNSGIYFVSVSTGETKITKRLIIDK